MAHVNGLPAALASSTIGLSALGSPATLPFRSAFRLMHWPLRFKSQGITIGFFGASKRPIVDAIGMPISMCVAWMSPFERASRIAAQLAPLVTFELIPYFLNRPFSWAITIGEQSVSAIMPKLTLGDSGPSVPPALGAADVFDSALSHPRIAAAPVRAVALSTFRREKRVVSLG